MNTAPLEHPAPTEHQENLHQKHFIAGFWRRLFAFLIDLIIVGLLCMVISGLIGKYIYYSPVLVTLVGYMLVTAYFGVCNSRIYQGRTLGKRLMSIQVMDLNHQYLSLAKSLLRAAVLYAPLCLSSLANTSSLWLNTLITVVLGCLFLSIIYLYIFNRKNRRSTHDFISDTIVVNENADIQTIEATWKAHFLIIATLVLLYAAVTSWNASHVQNETLTPMQDIQLNGLVQLEKAYINFQNIEGEHNNKYYLIAQIDDPKHLDEPNYVQELATHLADANLFSSQEDQYLQLTANYQFGVLTKLNSTTYQIKQNAEGIELEQVAFSQHTTLGGRY